MSLEERSKELQEFEVTAASLGQGHHAGSGGTKEVSGRAFVNQCDVKSPGKNYSDIEPHVLHASRERNSGQLVRCGCKGDIITIYKC